ncbi:MAG: glycerate kinase [Arthrobacter sp.]|nr:glycerate kinase [Arthrobacter sp.]
MATGCPQTTDVGDCYTYRRMLGPTEGLSRKPFEYPTYHYNTGAAFLSWLNGHQAAFSMIGGPRAAAACRTFQNSFLLLTLSGHWSSPSWRQSDGITCWHSTESASPTCSQPIQSATAMASHPRPILRGPRARVLIASDRFKHSMTSEEVAGHLTSGLLAERPVLTVDFISIADGGEGTVAAAISAGYTAHIVTVTGPTGLPVNATMAVRGHVAVIEVAAASGRASLPDGIPDALGATSLGTGELICEVLNHRLTGRGKGQLRRQEIPFWRRLARY